MGTTQQNGFEALNDLLFSAPVLRRPDFSLQFILQTDASGYGLGAVLSQELADGQHTIVYASRTLGDWETRHAKVEKEPLAISWSVHHFRHYLLGRHFIVQMEDKPLGYMHAMRDQNMRLQKLALCLQGYDFLTVHRLGARNQNTDMLSRYPVNPFASKRKGGGQAA